MDLLNDDTGFFQDEIEQILAKRREDKIRYENLLVDYREVFGTEAGRRVFQDLMELTGPFRCTFTGNSKTYFLEGLRSAGLYLLKMREVANAQDLEKLKEGNHARRDDNHPDRTE